MTTRFVIAKTSNRNRRPLGQRSEKLNRLARRSMTQLPLVRVKESPTDCWLVPITTTVPTKQSSAWCNHWKPHVEVAAPAPVSFSHTAGRAARRADTQSFASFRWSADLKSSELEATLHPRTFR